jgi:hypothetical protein
VIHVWDLTKALEGAIQADDVIKVEASMDDLSKTSTSKTDDSISVSDVPQSSNPTNEEVGETSPEDESPSEGVVSKRTSSDSKISVPVFSTPYCCQFHQLCSKTTSARVQISLFLAVLLGRKRLFLDFFKSVYCLCFFAIPLVIPLSSCPDEGPRGTHCTC